MPALMRFTCSFIFAVFIVSVLFQVMYHLVNNSAVLPKKVESLQPINISIPKENIQTKATQTAIEAIAEPSFSAPTIEMPIISAPDISTTISVDALAITVDLQSEFNQQQLGRVQHHWVQPSVSGQSNSDYVGEKDSGQTPVVPMATRQPLIPKIAWDNKIDGWVLLAFGVTNDGKVFDIRVMDAQPRGVFEAYAVAAVKKWRYETYQGSVKYVSQKIDFDHKNYPHNWGEF